jgi:hypothetical protein
LAVAQTVRRSEGRRSEEKKRRNEEERKRRKFQITMTKIDQDLKD